MLKKKTERLIPQSDQPKKQVSRGKVTVPKNSKQNALSTEKNSLENRKTAKKPTSGKKNSAGQKKTKSAKNKKPKFKNTAKIRSEKRCFKACEKRTQDNQSSRQLKGSE